MNPVSLQKLLGPAALLLCMSVIPAAAQQIERSPARQPLSLSQFAYQQWDDRDGLPQNSVQAITQSKQGYLWLGTQAGVVRFDGVRYEVFDAHDSPTMQRAYVWALESDGNGGVWVGSEEGGLVNIANGVFTAYTEKNGLPSKWVNALKRDRAGTLWIGTADAGLLRRSSDGKFQPVDFPAKYISSITEDTSGTIWFGSGKGLARIRNGVVQPVPLTAKPATVSEVVARPGGGVYAAISGVGIALVRNDEVQIVATSEQLKSGYVHALAVDHGGALWAGTTAGLVRIENGELSTFPAGQGPQYDVVSIRVDNEGSIWLGLDGGGFARMRATPIVPLGKPEGLASDMVYTVYQARNGDVWLGTGGEGVNVLRNGSVIASYNVQSGTLPNNYVISFAEDREGGIWVGTFVGVSRIKDGKAQVITAKDGLLPGLIRDIQFDRSGALWVGSHGGLQRFRPGPPRLFTTKDGLADDFVMTMLEDRNGALWVATRFGLSKIVGDRVQTYTSKHGLPNHGIMAMHEDAQGVLWIATGDGVSRFANGKFKSITVSDGFCARDVLSVLEDDHERLWFGSISGIFAVDKKDIERGRIHCRMFDRSAGMRTREVNGAANPPAWRMSDGRLWFSTVRGMAIVDPDNVQLNVSIPPVEIENIVAEGKAYRTLPKRLPAGVRTLEIHFTGLSFVSPERMRFRYKLDGFDADWVEAGARRVAYYTHLDPGRYTFRVQAANADGEWNEAGASALFTIAPFWYQTWEFRALAALLVTQLLFVLYRLRVRGLQARQRELMALADERGRAEARYRELFDNATDAVFTADLEGRLTEFNRKAEQLTGYRREQALGMNVRDLLPKTAEGERVVRQWLSGVADGTERVDVLTRDGSRVPVEVRTRLVTQDHVHTGVQAVARDCSDRAALERQLRQSQKMEAVGRLAGGVAHDFNNLLTVIRGNGELLLADMPEDAPEREDIEQINQAAERASALTRQLLAFSRKQVVHPKPLDLNVQLRDIEKMLQRLIGEDVTIVTLPVSEPACILADPTQIEQVLVNLAVNARDAMPDGGAITIETRIEDVEDVPQSPVKSASGRAVVLSVSDTGTGMDAETQSRIFDPFFTTKEPGKGTGLGLATVYGIVQQAGGQIVCSSAPGKGTTFRIYLPYSSESAAAATASERGVEELRGNETILLVEDEDSVRTLTARILRHAGYHVIEARHGQDALILAAEHEGTIDLLLTDMVMPVMNGRVLSELLLEQRPTLRVMLMSGYTDDEILRRGLQAPGVSYLQKPFTPNSLLRMVRNVLGSEHDAAAD